MSATTDSEDALVRKHLPMVRLIAHRVIGRLPANVAEDDLIQAGLIGLLDAIRRYQEMGNVPFRGYAAHRVYGAIMDSLRNSDPMPRSLRRKINDLKEIRVLLEHSRCRAASDREIASAAGITNTAYQMLVTEAAAYESPSLDDLLDIEPDAEPSDPAPSPLDRLVERDRLLAVARAWVRLPPTEKRLMALMYGTQPRTVHLASERLGLTVGNARYYHRRAVQQIREAIEEAA